MDARYTNVLKNYSDLAHRPTQQLLDAISVMFDRAPSVIKAHTLLDYWTYWTVVKNFDSLVAATTNVKMMIDDAEKTRKPFNISPQLASEYTFAKEEADSAFEAVRRIESGELRNSLQSKVKLLHGALCEAKLASVSRRTVNDLKCYKQLMAAQQQLLKLETSLLTSKTHHVINRQIAAKKMQIKNLTDLLSTTNSTTVVQDLQQTYDSAVLQLKSFKIEEVELLSQYNAKTKTALAALQRAESALNTAQIDHFGVINTTAMLGILRVYDRFITYKTSFDHAVSGKNNKSGVVTFQTELDARLQRVDQLMESLRGEELGSKNAKTIYAQLLKLTPPQRERILTQKTGSAELVKLMDLPRTSTSGLFKVDPVTAQQRSKLVYTKTDEERMAKKALYKNRAI
jgi:hypothetical protein